MVHKVVVFINNSKSKIKASIIDCQLLCEALPRDYLTENLKHHSTIGIITPISRIRKLRLKESGTLFPKVTQQRNWQNQHQNPALLFS